MIIDERWYANNTPCNFKQCRLQKGNVQQVSWIPEQFAVEGKVLRLFDEFGWKVISVSIGSVDLEKVKMLEEQHKHHRRNTDI